jgi:hypothetical protein
LPVWPAAKAALDAVMQNKRNAAAAISMVSLMVRSSQIRDIGFNYITERTPVEREQNPARSLHKNHACIAQSGPRRVSIPALSAYDSAGFELRDAHIVRSIAPD